MANHSNLKPGYWVVWHKVWESYEVVVVNAQEDVFRTMGNSDRTPIGVEYIDFIKPFDPEDIVLNKEIK